MYIENAAFEGISKMNRKGQFIVVGAIMIAAFMFALMLTMSQMNVQRQVLSPEPVDEVVLAVASDFERSLRAAFAKASQQYLESYLKGEGVTEAQQLLNSELQRWLEATSSAYSGYGLRIALAGGNGSNFDEDFYWSGNPGRSRIYATFEMDVESYGLRGLALTKSIWLQLNISKVNSTEGGTTIITEFKVDEKIGEGRSFTPSIKRVEAIVGGKRIYSGNISYRGQGVYLATFNVESPNVEEMTLAVTTEDNIVVAAKLFLAREAQDLNEWRTFFLVPRTLKEEEVIKGKQRVEYFYLSRNPTEPGYITPQISHGHPSRRGDSDEPLPELNIGPVTITLYARATSEDIPLNVTLGYELYGLRIIGSRTITVVQSNTFIPYTITIETNTTISEGSRLVLILERIDEEPGRGTLHIRTGQEYSRIELWPQP